MDAEQIDPVFINQVDEPVKMRRVLEADAHFHREQTGDGGAKHRENLADLFRIAEQAAADVLLVDLWRGAAEVQIDAGDVGPEQFLDRAPQVNEVLADELGEDWPSGGILIDRA